MKPASTLSQLPSSAVNRFTLLIHGLGRFVAAAAGPRYLQDKTAGLLLALASFRLDHIAKRFDRVITRLRNGTLESREPPPPTDSRQESGASSYYLGSPLGCLPKDFGWLVLLAPQASCYADELRDMLDDPEVAEQLAAVPQIAKLLRPIGNMLGVHSDLIGSGPRGLPRRPGARTQTYHPKPRPCPQQRHRLPPHPPHPGATRRDPRFFPGPHAQKRLKPATPKHAHIVANVQQTPFHVISPLIR